MGETGTLNARWQSAPPVPRIRLCALRVHRQCIFVSHLGIYRAYDAVLAVVSRIVRGYPGLKFPRDVWFSRATHAVVARRWTAILHVCRMRRLWMREWP